MTLTPSFKSLIFLVFFFVVSSLLLPRIGLADTPGEVKEGGHLREATLYGFAGDVRHLSDFHGKPLIINVWASWCPPCRAEMGSFEKLFERYGDAKFNLIGISTDDDKNAALAFLFKQGVNFANYGDYKLTMENMLGADTIPLTLLVSSEGKVLRKIRGFHQWDSDETIKMMEKVFGIRF